MQTEKDNSLIDINKLKCQNSNSLPKFLGQRLKFINFNYFWLRDSITIMMNNDDDDDDDDGGGGGASEDFDEVNQTYLQGQREGQV